MWQHGRWFVEDREVDAPIQGLEDLDPLFLTHRQVFDHDARPDLETIGLGQLGDSLVGRIHVEDPLALVAEDRSP